MAEEKLEVALNAVSEHAWEIISRQDALIRSLSARLAAASECLSLAAERRAFTPEAVEAILRRLEL